MVASKIKRPSCPWCQSRDVSLVVFGGRLAAFNYSCQDDVCVWRCRECFRQWKDRNNGEYYNDESNRQVARDI